MYKQYIFLHLKQFFINKILTKFERLTAKRSKFMLSFDIHYIIHFININFIYHFINDQ